MLGQEGMSQKVVGSNPSAEKSYFVIKSPIKCTGLILLQWNLHI